MSISWYHQTARETLQTTAASGRLQTRTCIIGGGLAGVATALSLIERGERDVLLLEAQQIGHGASGRNGGFVFGGYSVSPFELARRRGLPAARQLHAATLEAVRLVRRRIDRYQIDCEPVDEGVLWANWFRDPEILLQQQRRLADDFGVEWAYLDADQLRQQVHSPRYHGALREPEGFHVQPLALVRGMARAAIAGGARIHERSEVLGLARQDGRIRLLGLGFDVLADRVVVAGGGYLSGQFGPLTRAMLPIATYAMVTEPLGDRLAQCLSTRAAIYDTRFAFDYYRPLPDTRLLWGGRISIRSRSPEAVARLLSKDLTRVFPQLGRVRVEQAWSGLMSYARHEMPQIGQLQPDVWYAQGFGGHGLAPTTLAGEVLAAALRGEESPLLGELSAFDLPGVHRRSGLGLLAAQARYSWLQWCDRWRSWTDRG
ncbi:MAG: FAD-binding oxidoreductase [Xanthomonadales bacterium]|nr:FAD-binding oxidoreductase [Xanthomonadales bacterium]